MAVATKDRRFTRSRKTTVPDDLTEKPESRSLRSSKPASSDFIKKRNCVVLISKLKSEDTTVINKKGTKRISTGRKRTRVDNGEENEVEEETNAKVTHFYLLFFLLIMSTKRKMKKGCSNLPGCAKF